MARVPAQARVPFAEGRRPVVGRSFALWTLQVLYLRWSIQIPRVSEELLKRKGTRLHVADVCINCVRRFSSHPSSHCQRFDRAFAFRIGMTSHVRHAGFMIFCMGCILLLPAPDPHFESFQLSCFHIHRVSYRGFGATGEMREPC